MVHPFDEEVWYTGKDTGNQKSSPFLKMAEHLPSVSSPFKLFQTSAKKKKKKKKKNA